jgi:hypothetical protein
MHSEVRQALLSHADPRGVTGVPASPSDLPCPLRAFVQKFQISCEILHAQIPKNLSAFRSFKLRSSSALAGLRFSPPSQVAVLFRPCGPPIPTTRSSFGPLPLLRASESLRSFELPYRTKFRVPVSPACAASTLSRTQRFQFQPLGISLSCYSGRPFQWRSARSGVCNSARAPVGPPDWPYYPAPA